MKEKNTSIKIKLILTFVVLTVAIFFLLDSRMTQTRQEHLQQVTERYQLAYNTIYDQYKQLATIICSGMIKEYNVQSVYQQLLTADEEQKNRLRAELLSKTQARYEAVKKVGNVKQLHFHLRDNESFLRLHRPDKYGDNLTGIRETVSYVNTNHIAIDGFEEGRLFNGFRFVFPITATDLTHLGSMEVSFGPNVLTSTIMKEYFVLSNFFIRETPVRNKLFPGEFEKTYTQSHHNEYLYDKTVLEELKKVSRQEMKDLKPQKATTDTIYSNAHSGRAMSTYDRSIHSVFTTIPVLNPVTHEMVAFFTVRSQPDFIKHAERYYRLIFSLILLFLLTILSAFYMQYNKRKVSESNAKQLEKQRQQLLETQQIANIGHWELDHQANQLSWSDQTKRIFGLDPEEVAGTFDNFLEKVHPDDRVFVKESYMDSLKNQKPYDIQHRITSPDGTVKWVREKCTTEYDETGRPVNSLGIVHDITEQHKTLTLLQQERDTFMKGPVVTFTWKNSDNWSIEDVSANIITILGYSREELREGSTEYAKLIHPEDLQRVIDEVATHSVPETSSFTHEPYRLRKHNGESIWVLDTTTLVRDKKGEITHYRGYLIDITKTMQMEEEVLTTKKLLKATRYEEQRKRFESLKTMAGAIAHTFNNAMTVVQGNLGLLISTLPKNSDEHKMASDAEQAARGASRVGSMMLSYVGRQSLKCREIPIEALAKESVTALKDLFASLVSLKFTPPAQPLYCYVDQRKVEEVIESILTNAVESIADDSGTVEISFGSDYFSATSFPVPFQDNNLKDGMYSFCQIKDSGHGISAENLSRIFEPFYTTRFVGRGLGLALSVGIMRAHHGAITVASAPDCGTTVKVLLPSIPPPQQVTPYSDYIQLEEVHLSGNILLADDDEMVLDVGRKMLEMLGFSVHTVVDGLEAVEKIRQHTTEFCAVVLDISMPRMDGIAAMKAIREIDPALPVLLSSGYAESSFPLEEEEGSQPDGFLAKPFRLFDIQSSLEKLLS